MSRLLPLSLALSACTGAPPMPAAPPPPGDPIAAPAWLVEHVTPAHMALPAAAAADDALAEPFDRLEGWQGLTRAAHDPDVGHDAPGAVRLGQAGDAMHPRGEVKRSVPVPERTTCTVSAWVRTEGLEGSRLQGGAALEVRQTTAARGKGKEPSVFLHDHLPRLRGTTDWTRMELEVETETAATTLEVVLSGGRGTGRGLAWFDDVSVQCLDPVVAYVAGSPLWRTQPGAPVGRVEVARTERPSVLAPAGSAWSVRVDRSTDQVLRATVGLAKESIDRTEACFEIRVDGAVEDRACLDDRAGWKRLQVALPPQAGATSVVEFSTAAASGAADGALLLGAWGDPSLDPVGEDARPDVLLVIFDTLRADDLGVGGNTDTPASPGLDRLASQGTWYSQARSPTSWTLPSIATMLTGVTPPTHGAGWRIRREVRHKGKSGDARRPLDYSAVRPEAPKLAGILRDAGYRTTLLGSNHYLDSEFGFAAGFSAYGSYAGSSVPGVTRAFPRLNDAMAEEEEPGGRPHFVVLHLLEPHLPYRFRTPAPEGFTMPTVFETEHQESGGWESETLRKVRRKEEQHPEALKHMHQADFRFGDDQVATVLSKLPDDALIVVASDHGEAFGEHDTFLHGHNLFDETVHVPLIVRWPGGAHAGSTVDQNVGLAQIAPTILEQVGLPWSDMEGQPLPHPARPLADAPQYLEHIYKGPDRVGVLLGDLKRVRQLPNLDLDSRVKGDPGPPTLFDVRADPDERTDLTEARPEDAARLDALIDARIEAALPGTHVQCAAPHPALRLSAPAPFVRGVPMDVGAVVVEDDRRGLQVAAREEGRTWLVVEAADGAPIAVDPPSACQRWDNPLPRAGVQLEDEQLDQLEAIGYVED